MGEKERENGKGGERKLKNSHLLMFEKAGVEMVWQWYISTKELYQCHKCTFVIETMNRGYIQ